MKRKETRWRGRAKGSGGSIDQYTVVWGMGKLCTSDITGIRRLLTLGRIAIRFDDAWIGSCSQHAVCLFYRWLYIFSCLLLLPLSPSVGLPAFFPLQSGEKTESDEIIRKYTLFPLHDERKTQFVQLKIKFAGRHPEKWRLGGLHFSAPTPPSLYIACVQSRYSTSLTPLSNIFPTII